MGKRLQTVAAMTFMKTLLMLFNFIFWITGIAILALGIWMAVELYKYMELSAEFSSTVPYVLIGTGALIIIVGSLACCCTVKGQSGLLYVYATFLVIIFVLELGAGISGYAYRERLQDGFQKGLNQSFMDYGQDKEKTGAVDIIQSTLKCCGILKDSDWFDTPYQRVPQSCCRSKHPCNSENPEAIYHEGCYNIVIEFMNSNIGMVAGTAVGVAFFQLIGVFLSCCLARNINSAKYEQMA